MAFKNSVKVTLLSLENERARPYQTQQPAFRCEPDAPEPEPESRVVAPPPAVEIPLDPAWHARAEGLRAMIDTLPSPITRALMPKIAALYDDLAAEAKGSTAPEIPPGEDEPAPAAAPHQHATFPRRPLPYGRRISRRRG